MCVALAEVIKQLIRGSALIKGECVAVHAGRKIPFPHVRPFEPQVCPEGEGRSVKSSAFTVLDAMQKEVHGDGTRMRSNCAAVRHYCKQKQNNKIIIINYVVERRIKVTQQTELCLEIFQGCITSQQSDGFHLRGLISSALKLHNTNSAVELNVLLNLAEASQIFRVLNKRGSYTAE